MSEGEMHQLCNLLAQLDLAEWNTVSRTVEGSFQQKAIESELRLNDEKLFKKLAALSQKN